MKRPAAQQTKWKTKRTPGAGEEEPARNRPVPAARLHPQPAAANRETATALRPSVEERGGKVNIPQPERRIKHEDANTSEEGLLAVARSRPL